MLLGVLRSPHPPIELGQKRDQQGCDRSTHRPVLGLLPLGGRLSFGHAPL